jgi:hypothetical protein
MEKFKGKYEKLAESTLVRYQNGGVMTGDLVKVLPNALKHPLLKDLGDHVKAAIQGLIDSELNLRVGGVKSIYPASNSFSDGLGGATTDSPAGIWCDVVIEKTPGSWSNPITLPAVVLEILPTDGINLAPIPDALRRKDNVDIKGKEAKYENPNKINGIDYTDTHTNPKGNTVLDYVKGSAKQPVMKDSVQRVNDDDLLSEAYGRIFNAPKSKVFTVCVANAFVDNMESFLATESLSHIKSVQGHKTFFDVVFAESKDVLEARIKKEVLGANVFLTVTTSDQQIDENN